jgi:hypothetical protein
VANGAAAVDYQSQFYTCQVLQDNPQQGNLETVGRCVPKLGVFAACILGFLIIGMGLPVLLRFMCCSSWRPRPAFGAELLLGQPSSGHIQPSKPANHKPPAVVADIVIV